MLGTDVVMIEWPCFFDREFKHFFSPGSKWNIADDQWVWASRQALFQFFFQLGQIYSAFLHDSNSYAATIFDYTL